MPRLDQDRFLITWTGEIEALREFVTGRAFTVYVTAEGRGRAIRIELFQVTPKLRGNRRIARLGDTVRYDQALLVVDRAVPRRTTPGQSWTTPGLFPVAAGPPALPAG